MLIYAHRGASALEPANTLAAFERAITDEADGIELDVHLSADGVPVVIHDRDLEHTTDGRGRVDEKELSELKTLDAGGGQRIPTLEEVLTLVAGRVRFYLEIKQPTAEAATLDVLSRFPDTAWIAASFDRQVLSTLRELAPRAELWLITTMISDSVLQAAGDLAVSTVSLWSETTSPAVAGRLFDADFDLAVWTVNDVAVARRAKQLGASALCTDNPKLIRSGLHG